MAMMRSTADKSLDKARAAVLAERAKLELHQGKAASAAQQLAELEASVGRLALDDPAAALAIPERLQALRDLKFIAERAVVAQQPAVTAAELAFLETEAKALEPAVAAAAERLAKHEARRDELVAQLEKHEGTTYVREFDVEMEQRSSRPDAFVGQVVVVDDSQTARLRGELRSAERPILVLREIMAGRDPAPMVSSWGIDPAAVYPASVWGPDALVPVAAFGAKVASRRQQREALVGSTIPGLEALLADLDAQVEEAIATGHRRDVAPSAPGLAPTVGDRREATAQRLAEVRAEVQEIDAELVSLVGS